MAAAFDIQLGSDGDLIIQNDDYVYDLSDQQHIKDTINAFPGSWKETFADGVGALSYLNSSGKTQQLARSIKIQLTNDGYSVGNVQLSINQDTITVKPNAVRN